jgi:hypothetical protein
MVTAISSVADPYPPPISWLVARRVSQVLLTRHDVQEMMRSGIVPEDTTTELLHGVLLHTDRSARGGDPLSIGEEHTICVETLSDLRTKINSDDRHVRSQQPLICSETHEPQPDFMILRGTLRSHRGKPTAADAYCVVEVADSSYDRDAGEKLFGYARALIEQYIIINLVNRTAEVYATPDPVSGSYAAPLVIRETESVSFRVGPIEFMPILLADLLP